MEIGIFISLSDVMVRKSKGYFWLLENEALGEISDLYKRKSFTDAGGLEMENNNNNNNERS